MPNLDNFSHNIAHDKIQVVLQVATDRRRDDHRLYLQSHKYFKSHRKITAELYRNVILFVDITVFFPI